MSKQKREKKTKQKKQESSLARPSDEAIEERVSFSQSEGEQSPEPQGEDLAENLEK